MSLKKELTMKTAAEIFKLASRIGIKPKDIARKFNVSLASVYRHIK